MSTSRKFGAFLCVLGFVAVCIMAFVSTMGSPFAGLMGIQTDIRDQALELLGDDAPLTEITASGRDLRIVLPAVANEGFDRDAYERQLNQIDGVRNVELVGDPRIASLDGGDSAEPDPAPEPTEVPATPEPAPEPTDVPEPTATAEPTAVPQASLGEIVAGFDAGAIEFEPGTAQLTTADQSALDEIAEQLAGRTGGPIQVQAHTDDVGDPDVNLLLSQDRAAAVVEYLTDQGVDGALLTSRGFGASQPIADNSTAQGRAENRRVMFVVEGN